MTYNPICYSDDLIIGTGEHIAIVTCWTPRERIAKLLSPDQYAVIGNLYSVKGIDYLVRNLLANPKIKSLVVYHNQNSKLDTDLRNSIINFFVGRLVSTSNYHEFQYLNTPFPKIYSDISAYALEVLREDCQLYHCNNEYILTELVSDINSSNQLHPYNNFREQFIYPPQPINVKSNPPNPSGHYITGQYIDTTWREVLYTLLNNGVINNCSRGQWQELYNLHVSLNLSDSMLKNCNTALFKEHPFSINKDLDDLYDYQRTVIYDIQDDQKTYTYGQRIRTHFNTDQLQNIVTKLKHDRNTTQAVISLYDPFHDSTNQSPPCLVLLQFRIINNRLSFTAVFRSHDLYKAWVDNVYALSEMMIWVIDELGDSELELGKLDVISMSGHIYVDDLEDAEEYARRKINYDDPIGNFIITWDGQYICIEHQCENNYFTLKNTDPMRLIKDVGKQFSNLSGYHALYLGREIERCGNLKDKYIQDR